MLFRLLDLMRLCFCLFWFVRLCCVACLFVLFVVFEWCFVWLDVLLFVDCVCGLAVLLCVVVVLCCFGCRAMLFVLVCFVSWLLFVLFLCDFFVCCLL